MDQILIYFKKNHRHPKMYMRFLEPNFVLHLHTLDRELRTCRVSKYIKSSFLLKEMQLFEQQYLIQSFLLCKNNYFYAPNR
jgi:hypothetical protein